MSVCKLHIPWLYDPLKDEYSCECGAFRESAVERADKRRPRQPWKTEQTRPMAPEVVKPCPVCGRPDDTCCGVCRKCVANNPTRVMCWRTCEECHYAWRQPARTGRCPRCRSLSTTTVSMQVSGLKRL